MSIDDPEDLEQVIILQPLKSEAVDGYREAHNEVPDSVIESMNESGVEEYELYAYEDIAIGIMSVHDLEEFEIIYGSDPDN